MNNRLAAMAFFTLISCSGLVMADKSGASLFGFDFGEGFRPGPSDALTVHKNSVKQYQFSTSDSNRLFRAYRVYLTPKLERIWSVEALSRPNSQSQCLTGLVGLTQRFDAQYNRAPAGLLGDSSYEASWYVSDTQTIHATCNAQHELAIRHSDFSIDDEISVEYDAEDGAR